MNNVGSIFCGPVAGFTHEDWTPVIHTNLTSFQGSVNVSTCAAGKHGVAGLAKAFAEECLFRGVQVDAPAPGYIATNNTEALWRAPGRSAEMLGPLPAGRWGKPESLAGTAVFLTSPAAEYISGHILTVDGEWMAR